jgi:16S rRNA (uracil1498-N3)-methyltransferase
VTRAPVPALTPGERRLEGPVAHYLARVLRLRAGSEFIAFDPACGTEADAVVLHVAGDAVAVRLGATRPGRAAAPREVTWIQGFAKGDKCDAIVRDATELGATRIVIASTRRSIVKLDDARASARAARWSRIAEEAARQCGRREAPRVDRPMPWADALACAGAGDARFCLWEGATEPLAPGLFDVLARGSPLAFACGPEGGIEDDEVAQATTQGWRTTSLGPLLLRTETVAAAVLGAVRVWSGLLGRSGA